MLKQQLLRRAGLLFITALVIPMIAACGQAPEVQIIKETVVVKETAEPVATTEAVAPVVTDTSFTTPHPLLGDVRIRQAIAFCTNRPELIKSVYPFLTEEQQQGLLMAKSHQSRWQYC